MSDVFDQDTNSNSPAPVNTDPFADKLKTIVNDQGQPKYKDVDTALAALAASQEHIKRLETESATNKTLIDSAVAEKARADALEEVVKRLSSNSERTPTVDQPQGGVDEAAVVATLNKLLEQRDAQSVAKTNASSVQSALIAKFGDVDKAREAVAAKAAELGTTPKKLGDLSAENPTMALALLGITAVQRPANPSTPSPSPLIPTQTNDEIKHPGFSLISGPGATDKNRKDIMAAIKAKVYKDHNVEI